MKSPVSNFPTFTGLQNNTNNPPRSVTKRLESQLSSVPTQAAPTSYHPEASIHHHHLLHQRKAFSSRSDLLQTFPKLRARLRKEHGNSSRISCSRTSLLRSRQLHLLSSATAATQITTVPLQAHHDLHGSVEEMFYNLFFWSQNLKNCLEIHDVR